MTTHFTGLRSEPIAPTTNGRNKPDTRPRSVTNYAVFDAGRPSGREGQKLGFAAGTFRRDSRDNRPAHAVPMPGDPPADLEARRALAEAGNPQVERNRRGIT